MSFDIQRLPRTQPWGNIWTDEFQRVDITRARRALLRLLRERVLQSMGADLELLDGDTCFSGSSIGVDVLEVIDPLLTTSGK